MTTPHDALAHIAQELGETSSEPIDQIKVIIEHCGAEKALTWLAETQRVEAQGGLLTKNRKRRRTPGGVFFHLVRAALEREDDQRTLRAVFQRTAANERTPAASVSELPILAWGEIPALVKQAEGNHGAASTVKTTIKGVPSGVRIVEQAALFRLTHDSSSAIGVADVFPRPQAPIQTAYAVVVAGKQWRTYDQQNKAQPEPLSVASLEGVAYWQPGGDGKGGAFALLVTKPPLPIPAKSTTTRAEVLIVGRPVTMHRYRRAVVFTMRLAAPPSNLPKGLPVPSSFPLATYVCVVDARKWDKTLGAALAANPNDKLVLRGTPVWHAQAQAIVAWITVASTQALDRAQWQAKEQAEKAESSEA